MSVELSIEKGTASALISCNVLDLQELVDQSDEEKRRRILQRLQQELSQCIEAEQYTDESLEQQAREAAMRVAKLKAARAEVVAVDAIKPIKR